MKVRHLFKSVFFVMLAGIMIFLSDAILTGKDNAGKSGKKKMYISSIKSDDVKKPLLDRIRNGITLSILDNYGSVYQILDDEAVKVMYSQAEKIIASGCDDTSCITQIADGINADEIIYGEVSFTGGKVKLVMKSLVRKNIELDTKSMVNVSFREGQADWFAAETAKKLVNPKYRIDPSKAPREFNSKIDIKGIHIGGTENFNIEVMRFTTTDDQIQNILGYLKGLISTGDEYFAKGGYKESVDKYSTVIEKIDTKLRAGSREKMKSFRSEAAKRVDASYAMIYRGEMEEVDAKLKSEDEADESFLNKIISGYKDVLEDMKDDIPKRFYGENNVRLEKAIADRIDSCLVSICGLHEKFGDTAYNSYSFDRALEEYRKAAAISKTIAGAVKKSIAERCDLKILATYKTGKSYLENKVKSYTDLAEFFNVKDETSDAKGMIKEAESLMTGRMLNFVTPSAIENYNNTAVLFGFDRITEKTEPEIYVRLNEEIRLRREAEEAEKRKRFEKRRKQLIAQMKRKGQFRTGKTATFGGMKFVLITGGTYTMGSPVSEKHRNDDETQHKVTLSPFWIGKYEVTRKDIVEVTRKDLVASSRRYGARLFPRLRNPNFPVGDVSWYAAVGFCNRLSREHGLPPYYKVEENKKDSSNTSWLDNFKYKVTILGGTGFRLPTEAEWEYACKAGTTTAFHYGNKLDSTMANFDGRYPYNSRRRVYRERLMAVGSYKPNAWGLYDMHGNIVEWCFDWYGTYSGYANDPKGADGGSSRVLRGGGYPYEGRELRSSCRLQLNPCFKYDYTGLRLARSL